MIYGLVGHTCDGQVSVTKRPASVWVARTEWHVVLADVVSGSTSMRFLLDVLFRGYGISHSVVLLIPY